MDRLPEDILIEIFQYLDNQSMLNVLNSCKFFAYAFSTSSKLLLKFNLQISPQNVNQLLKTEIFQHVPFKNITISDVQDQSDLIKLEKFLRNFADFVDILELKNVCFKHCENFLELFSKFKNVKDLKLEECLVSKSEVQPLSPIPSLKSLTFEECCQNIFKLFIHQNSVEKVKLFRNKISNFRYLFDNFNLMTAAMPNLNHVIINGFAASSFFDSENFPFKVQKFEATLLTGWWSVTEPRLNFLKSQQETLKELMIHRLPYDDDGNEVLNFIIEEMKLQKFYLRKNLLILNGVKQDVRKLTVSEYEVCSMYEMFRQYPIEFLTLRLTHTHIDEPAVNQIINPETNLFENLQSLRVIDRSRQLYNFPRFLGLYKNCRKIKKFSISTNDDNINFVLRQCLPEMTQLTEISLNVDIKINLAKEMFEIVRKYVKNLEKLEVLEKFDDNAKKIFGEKIQITGI